MNAAIRADRGAGARSRHRHGDESARRAVANVRRVSTRGGPQAAAIVHRHPARGPRARRRPAWCPSSGRASCAPKLDAMRDLPYPRARLRDHCEFRRRLSRRRPEGRWSSATYTTESFGTRRHHPADDSSSRTCTSSASRTARRSRSRTSRCSCSGNLFENVLEKQRRARSTSSARPAATPGSAAEYALRGQRSA